MATRSCASRLTKAEKKAVRKQLRQINNLRRHNAELANISESPTAHLVIGNGGLMCGVHRSQIVNLFRRFGRIERVSMLPGRSYSFISFQNADDSRKAVENIHGRVLESPAEFPKRGVSFYLSYLTEVPDDDIVESGVRPPGLNLVNDFVTEEEEEVLLKALGFADKHLEDDVEGTANQQLRHRRVRHFGYEFLYGTNNVDKANPLPGGIPSVCDQLLDRIQQHVKFRPDQMTVNEYRPGQGIPPHVDTHSAFEDGIVSLSLGSQVTIEFRHPDGRHISVVLPRRSLLVMIEESRYLWSHGITPRKFDIITDEKSTSKEECPAQPLPTEMEDHQHIREPETGTTLFERQTRVSLTLRKIRHSPCACKFPEQCDSQGYKSASKPSGTSKVPTSEEEARELEKKHVHDVYEKIADHFSGTRHSPWPKIAEFLRELPIGSSVADVGCGNGKYLGINSSIFKTGSDRSFNLASICKERGFAVIVCDILSLPYRSDAFDVCLCIAVLHHLSTTERRLAGLRELVRITRPGGLVLVYVWALEQEAKKVKRGQVKEMEFESNRDNTSQQNEDIKTKTCTAGVESARDAPRESPQEEGKATDYHAKNVKLNVNRDSFEQQELFVPWRYSGSGIKKGDSPKTNNSVQANESRDDHVFHRYYHVFEDGELQELCSHLDNVTVRNLYYEKGNWCILLEKTEGKT